MCVLILLKLNNKIFYHLILTNKTTMKSLLKLLLILSLMVAFLFAGVSVGNSMDSINLSVDDPKGWACTNSNGLCKQTHAHTCCIWSPWGCGEEPCLVEEID